MAPNLRKRALWQALRAIDMSRVSHTEPELNSNHWSGRSVGTPPIAAQLPPQLLALDSKSGDTVQSLGGGDSEQSSSLVEDSDIENKQTNLRAGVLLLKNFDLFPFAGFTNVLLATQCDADKLEAFKCISTIVSTDRLPIQSHCGVAIHPREELGNPKRFDYIVVFGGPLNSEVRIDDEVLEYLRTAFDAQVTLIGIGSGSIALIEAGLMHGRRCCVSWGNYHDLVSRYSCVKPVTDCVYFWDGQLISCAGGSAAVELAACLVEHHFGKPIARRSLQMTKGDLDRPDNASRPMFSELKMISNHHVKRAVELISQNLDSPIQISRLARKLELSSRQLARLFHRELRMSPLEFGREYRLQYALSLLRSTQLTVTEIAQESGFSDSSHLSRLVRKALHKTPKQVRNELT